MLFHVKICGVTTPDDAAAVAAAGADAIGLNFVAGSPRALGIEQARAVSAAVPAGVLKVGVFAGASAAEIRRIVTAVGLDAVQLHGHLAGDGPGVDPPERCAELVGLTVIRAVRMESPGQAGRLSHGARAVRPSEVPTSPTVGQASRLSEVPTSPTVGQASRLSEVPTSPTVGQASRLSESPPTPPEDPLAAARAWLAAASALGSPPTMVIVDAPVTRGTAAGQLGGTGATVDWAALAAAQPLGLPTALAGGLAPDTVAHAISVSKAAAVDAASGVESAPGRKDPAKVRAFVAAARTAIGATAKPR